MWSCAYPVSGVLLGSCEESACAHGLCENGAVCIEDGEGWYCNCLANYAGRYCERTHCDINPCYHGGSCVVTEDGTDYMCICPYGRHGVDCSLALEVTLPHFPGVY